MANPIQDKSKFEKCYVNLCCFFLTLRAGSLVIGVFEVIEGILWVIGGGTSGGGAFTGVISGLLLLISGVLVLLAIYKGNVQHLWWAVYLTISVGIWLFISALIMFFTLRIGFAIVALINTFLILYCAAVLRSYAFEFGTTTDASTNPA